MPLSEITEHYNNTGGEYLRYSWVKPELFYKKFEEDVIQQYTNRYHHQVPDKLDSPSHCRIGKYHIAHQHEPYWECNAERNNESADMGTDRYKRQLNDLFLQYEIVTDEIYEDIKQCISSTASEIAECFLIHERPERRIEKINGIDDQVLQNEGAKVILS